MKIIQYFVLYLSSANAVPLWAGLAPGCGATAASSSYTGDPAAHSIASACAVTLPLPPPGPVGDTPSVEQATPASLVLALTGSHWAPAGRAKIFNTPSERSHSQSPKPDADLPLSVALFAACSGVSETPASRSTPSSAGPRYAAETSSLL